MIYPTNSSSPATLSKCRTKPLWRRSCNNSQRSLAMPRKPKSKKTSAVRRQLATAPHCHPGFDRIKSLAASIHELQLQMAKSHAPIVQNIIQRRSRNVQEIEQALDRVLDCACIPEGLELFKHLCRYYYPNNYSNNYSNNFINAINNSIDNANNYSN